MMRSMIPLLLGLACLVPGCGYTPPAGVDRDSLQYNADLEACDTSVPQAINRRNAKTGLRWLASGFTRWSEIDDGIAACMTEKGWGRVRNCTAEELKNGGNARNLVVTASGVRCSDPGKRS